MCGASAVDQRRVPKKFDDQVRVSPAGLVALHFFGRRFRNLVPDCAGQCLEFIACLVLDKNVQPLVAVLATYACVGPEVFADLLLSWFRFPGLIWFFVSTARGSFEFETSVAPSSNSFVAVQLYFILALQLAKLAYEDDTFDILPYDSLVLRTVSGTAVTLILHSLTR